MWSWKRYAAALALNTALAVSVLLLKGFDLKIYYVDAFSVAGAVSILSALLVRIAQAGAFDMVGYGFSSLLGDRKYRDLYEYTLRKKEKRDRQGKNVLPYIITGFFFLGISFLLAKL